MYNASLIVTGTITTDVDEKVLTRWAHTPSVFWPAAAGFVLCALLLVAALSSMGRAALASRLTPLRSSP